MTDNSRTFNTRQKKKKKKDKDNGQVITVIFEIIN